jgi:hypothetical protein
MKNVRSTVLDRLRRGWSISREVGARCRRRQEAELLVGALCRTSAKRESAPLATSWRFACSSSSDCSYQAARFARIGHQAIHGELGLNVGKSGVPTKRFNS